MSTRNYDREFKLEEVYLLKKQLADVTMERDILKKAIAIFSKPKGIK
jgi:transposase-like protein